MKEMTFSGLSQPPSFESSFFRKSRLGVFLRKTSFLFVFRNSGDIFHLRFVLFANSQDLIELFSLLKHDADQTEEQYYPKAFGSDSI